MFKKMTWTVMIKSHLLRFKKTYGSIISGEKVKMKATKFEGPLTKIFRQKYMSPLTYYN